MNAKFNRLTLFVSVLASVLIGSCTIVDVDPGDDNNPGTMDDEPQMVNTGTMRVPVDSTTLVTYLHNGSSKVWNAEEFNIEGLPSFLRCRLDDQIEIFSDGTYIYNGGDNLCGAEDNETFRDGTWELDLSRNQLVFDRGTDRQARGEFVTLEENEIVLSGQYISDLFGTFDIIGRYVSN